MTNNQSNHQETITTENHFTAPEKRQNIESKKQGYNLLKIPFLKSFIKSRWYPGIFQWIALIIFAVMVYELVAGTVNPHKNFGTSMTWVLWWPVIPIVFVLVGRFWCAICPFGKISDIVRKLVGAERPMPRFLKKYGIWIIDATFILITWGDHIWGIIESPRGSGYLLLGLFTMVVATSVFYARRTFCRSLCFLGGLAGNYARAGMLELRGTPEKCASCKDQSCYKGNTKVEGCPMFEYVGTMKDSAECNLCGNCVKTCPNDSVQIRPRIATRELWNIHNPRVEHAFLATVIMGIVFIQNITMLEIWQDILSGISKFTMTDNFNVNFTVAFIIAMLIPISMLLIASKLAVKTGLNTTVKQGFTLFGYAIIPLDLAGHIAHNLFHLLTEGKAIWFNTMGLFGMQHGGDLMLMSDESVRILQFAVLVLGYVGSSYAIYRIGNKASLKKLWPYYLLIFILAIVNYYIFTLPMDHRVH